MGLQFSITAIGSTSVQIMPWNGLWLLYLCYADQNVFICNLLKVWESLATYCGQNYRQV